MSSSSAPAAPLPLATSARGNDEPSILLIHGLGDGSFVWHPLLSCLAHSYSTLAVDLRGHGDSPRDLSCRYGADSHVADLVALIDRLDRPRMILAGHSLGAEIAIRAAAARPDRVSAVVIIESGPELSERAAFAFGEHLSTMAWRYPTVAAFVQILVQRHMFAETSVLERYASSALRPAEDGGFELKADPALRMALARPDAATLWQALEGLDCPKLVVRGFTSAFLSQRNAEHMAQRLRNCRLVVVPRAGHGVPLDNPTGLHAAISPFLAEVAT